MACSLLTEGYRGMQRGAESQWWLVRLMGSSLGSRRERCFPLKRLQPNVASNSQIVCSIFLPNGLDVGASQVS